MAWIQLFPVLGCVGTLCLACSCEEHEHAADASPRPDRSIPDAGPDLSPPKEDAGSPWKRDLGPDPDLNLAMCSDGSVAVDPSDLAVSLDTTPDLKWTVSLHKGNGAPTSPVLDHDGTVYLPTLKGLFAVSSAGKLAWSLPPPGGSFLLGGHGGLFNGTFVTGAQHTIHGIDVKKQTFWTIPLQGPLDSLTKTAGMFHTSAPGLLTPGTVAVAGADHRLYRMTLGGKLLGTSMMPGIASLPRFPAMDVAGNTYFSIIASGARLASFGPEGKLRWMRSLQPIPRSSVLSVAVGGPSTVVVASYNGTVPQPGTEVFTTDVAALDSGCGAERWRVTLDGIPRSQLLVGPRGNTYLALEQPERVVAVSPEGKLAWTAPVDSSLFTVGLGPIGADGTIHAVLERAKLAVPSEIRAHSPDNGKLLWNVPIPGLHAMPNVPVLRDDGVLLVGMVLDHEQANETTVLVAVQTRSPGLARSGWPRDHHDNRNTCNAGSPLP